LFSKILEEHQDSCEKLGKFVEAEIAKQKVIQFKQLEKDKLIMDTKRQYEEQVRYLLIFREMLLRVNKDRSFSSLMNTGMKS
jgi:hypothetical protein